MSQDGRQASAESRSEIEREIIEILVDHFQGDGEYESPLCFEEAQEVAVKIYERVMQPRPVPKQSASGNTERGLAMLPGVAATLLRAANRSA